MESLLAVLDDNSLDVIVAPSTGTAWMTNYETGDQFTGGSGAHAAVAGYPHLTVPMGTINALPVGMSFFGRPFDDARVLAIGYAYEQQRGDRHTHVISVEPPPPLERSPRGRPGM